MEAEEDEDDEERREEKRKEKNTKNFLVVGSLPKTTYHDE